MDLRELRDVILRYVPQGEQETVDRQLMLQWLECGEDLLSRENLVW